MEVREGGEDSERERVIIRIKDQQERCKDMGDEGADTQCALQIHGEATLPTVNFCVHRRTRG